MTCTPRRIALVALSAAIALATPSRASGAAATVYQCTGPGGQAVSTDMVASSAAWAVTLRNCGSPFWPWGLMLSTVGTPGTSWLAGHYGEALVSAPPTTMITGG